MKKIVSLVVIIAVLIAAYFGYSAYENSSNAKILYSKEYTETVTKLLRKQGYENYVSYNARYQNQITMFAKEVVPDEIDKDVTDRIDLKKYCTISYVSYKLTDKNAYEYYNQTTSTLETREKAIKTTYDLLSKKEKDEIKRITVAVATVDKREVLAVGYFYNN